MFSLTSIEQRQPITNMIGKNLSVVQAGLSNKQVATFFKLTLNGLAQEMMKCYSRTMANKDTNMDDLAESIATLSTMVANEFTKVRQEFASVRQEFVRVNQEFVIMHQQFARVNQEFAKVHQEFHGVKTRLGYLENETAALRNDVKELYTLVR